MLVEKKKIATDCWNNALHCLATSYIFQQKADRYEKWIRLNTMLGLMVPLCMGGIALSYSGNKGLIDVALIAAAPLSVFQIILSGVVLVNKWDSKLGYCLESMSANRVIYDKYITLAKHHLDDTELNHRFDLVRVEDDQRTRQDEKISFSAKENRTGMRYALWILQRPCGGCGKVPLDLEASSCNVCGNY
jgi:mobilome CxxCx(11)CxxC protein